MRRLQLYENGSAPPSPETDRVYLYAKADGNLYVKTSDGVEHSLGGGSVSFPIAINQGGTGQTTAQAAINALTGSSGATTGQVLTRAGNGAAVWANAALPGTVAIDQGGTGQTTRAAAISALTDVSSATSGQVLAKAQDGSVGWATVVTPSDVIAIDQGGTGQTTAQAAFDALAGVTADDNGKVLGAVDGSVDFVVMTDADAVHATVFDAKGDLLAGTGADTYARVVVGTNGQVLTADSSQEGGVAWTDIPTPVVPAHNELSGGLDWTGSGHTGAVSSVATFDGSGNPATVQATVENTMLVFKDGVLKWVPVAVAVAVYFGNAVADAEFGDVNPAAFTISQGTYQ